MNFWQPCASDACDALIATLADMAPFICLTRVSSAFSGDQGTHRLQRLTTLQIYLWQKHRWTGFYGPMLAAGLNHGAGAPGGYDDRPFCKRCLRATELDHSVARRNANGRHRRRNNSRRRDDLARSNRWYPVGARYDGAICF